MMGIESGGLFPRLLPHVHGPPDIPPALKVYSELGSDLPHPCAIAHLQAGSNAPVQLPPPCRPQSFIQYPLVQRMPKPIDPRDRPVRQCCQPDVFKEVVRRRQPFTHPLDMLHRALSLSRHRRRRKHLAHHTGDLQHPPCLGFEGLDAPHQQLP
jgi:hypothetical protein